jgi:uncharacterized protein involved in tolerance to divalent cations
MCLKVLHQNSAKFMNLVPKFCIIYEFTGMIPRVQEQTLLVMKTINYKKYLKISDLIYSIHKWNTVIGMTQLISAA